MFTFRKIGSIVLLSLVIIIALLFSIIPKATMEGLETITATGKAEIDAVLNNASLSYLDKIVRIKTMIGNDTVLNDAYKQNETLWYKDIMDVLKNYPPYEEEGTLTQTEGELINAIVLDASKSNLDKIVQIYPNIGKDLLLQNIYEQYPKIHINMIRNYIEKGQADADEEIP
jgi:hypothetical protein